MSKVVFKCWLCDCIVAEDDKATGKRKMKEEFKSCKECDGKK